MSNGSPPPFENKATCTKCGTAFGLIKRKHHCRNCSRTYCGDCSAKTIALPHFNITEQVRVCDPCFNTVQQQMALAQHQQSSSGSPSLATPTPAQQPQNSAQLPITSAPARVTSPQAFSAGAGTFSPFAGFGRTAAHAYDLNGNLDDQLRHAIKNGDVNGVKQLLQAGADCNYVDHTKNSVLHLAAMFDKIEIVKLLMDKGANAEAKNLQGESPLDIAPPAMQHKMREALISSRATV